MTRSSEMHFTDMQPHQLDRRLKKPLMEKKRRARINRCLTDLKSLLLQASSPQGAKLEKADILEMTVQYIRNSQATAGGPANAPPQQVQRKFAEGYSACAQTMVEFLRSTTPGSPVPDQLLTHLQRSLRDRFTTPTATGLGSNPASGNGLSCNPSQSRLLQPSQALGQGQKSSSPEAHPLLAMGPTSVGLPPVTPLNGQQTFHQVGVSGSPHSGGPSCNPSGASLGMEPGAGKVYRPIPTSPPAGFLPGNRYPAAPLVLQPPPQGRPFNLANPASGFRPGSLTVSTNTLNPNLLNPQHPHQLGGQQSLGMGPISNSRAATPPFRLDSTSSSLVSSLSPLSCSTENDRRSCCESVGLGMETSPRSEEGSPAFSISGGSGSGSGLSSASGTSDIPWTPITPNFPLGFKKVGSTDHHVSTCNNKAQEPSSPVWRPW